MDEFEKEKRIAMLVGGIGFFLYVWLISFAIWVIIKLLNFWGVI